MTLKRISDWSAVNPLQNECICHLFDGNLGELGAFLQTYIWEIQEPKSVIFKIIWARKG
jgi:hypothetical protein